MVMAKSLELTGMGARYAAGGKQRLVAFGFFSDCRCHSSRVISQFAAARLSRASGGSLQAMQPRARGHSQDCEIVKAR